MFRFEGRPIFICGWPRGATRMVANLVSSHPDVIRSSEFPLQAVLAIHEAVLAIDRKKGSKERRRHFWDGIRQDYFLNAIRNTYKKPGRGSRFSNKTPSMELGFEAIMDACRENPPLFVYCVRHPHKVIRSLMNMPWNSQTPGERLSQMVESTRKLDQMNAAGASVTVVQLDKVGDEREERAAFARSLMGFLELAEAPELDAYIDEWPVAQPASSVLRGASVNDLSTREDRRLRSSRKYRMLCERFGYDAK